MQKTRSIATLPNTIQMQIQRAEITYEEKCIDEKTKQEKTVEKRIPLHPNVPEFLDFGPYLSNPPAAGEKTLYRLDFIMCRSGGNRAEEGGHNWLIKQEGDNKWIKYDDGAVSEYTWEQVQPELNKNVYALFYEKIR
jgi:ubiquitin C-terminal hydrolase